MEKTDKICYTRPENTPNTLCIILEKRWRTLVIMKVFITMDWEKLVPFSIYLLRVCTYLQALDVSPDIGHKSHT